MKQIFFILFYFISFFSFGQELVVKGTVLDKKNGELLPFVNVSTNIISKGTVTDFEGEFSISIKQNDTLTFTFIGYKTQKIRVDQNKINVQLEEIDEKTEIVLPYNPNMQNEIRNRNKLKHEVIDEKELKKNRSIKGKVTHESGEVLAGSIIKIKNTKSETITNFDGEFEIEATKNDIITVSFPGFPSKEIKVSESNYYDIILNNYTSEMTRKQKRELKKKGYYIYED